MINPASIPLTVDERTILQVLADSTEPLTAFAMFSTINPAPKVRDGRRREHRLWTERQNGLYEVLVALWKAQFLFEAVPADGWNADQYAITDAGHVALAVAAEEER